MFLSTHTSIPSPAPTTPPPPPSSPTASLTIELTTELTTPRSTLPAHFSGARALARLDAYQRLLERSLSPDFGLTDESGANATRLAPRPDAQSPRGPFGMLVTRFIESVQTFFETHKSAAAPAHLNETHDAAIVALEARDATHPASPSPLPFTLSGILKKFRRCDRSFSDVIMALIEDSGTTPDVRKQLFMAADRLDTRFENMRDDAQRAKLCDLFVKMGENVDSKHPQAVVNAILRVAYARDDKQPSDTTDVTSSDRDEDESSNATSSPPRPTPRENVDTPATIIPHRTSLAVTVKSDSVEKSPAVVRASVGATVVGGATALASPLLYKQILGSGAIDVAAAGLVITPDTPSILPVATLDSLVDAGAAANAGVGVGAGSGASLALDPTGALAALPQETQDKHDEQDPTSELRARAHQKPHDGNMHYDYLHWRSQEADIDRIAVDDSINGEPLFFEWNDSEARTARPDANDALVARLIGSDATNNAPPPLFRWFEDAAPPPSLLPRDTVSIDGSILIPDRDENGQPHWRSLPLTLYEGPPAPAIETGQWVEVNGIKHIRIDNRLYPIRETLPGQLWIYSQRNSKLPMLPLVSDGQTWRVQPGPDIAPPEPPLQPDERAIRYHDGEKFVLSGSARLPVDGTPVIGEDDIQHLAVPLSQIGRLNGPNEEGFLEGPDHKLWIEGETGFYPVDRINVTTREVSVEGMAQTATQALRYHHALQHWHLIEKAISNFAITQSLSFKSIDSYKRRLAQTVFLQNRKPLKMALNTLFDTLRELKLGSFNQPWAAPPPPELRDRLYFSRSAMSAQLYKIKNWNGLSPLQKQYADAKVQTLLLHAFKDDIGTRPAGLCGEHAGLAFDAMPSAQKRDGSTTRITFREFPGTGRNHEALLISSSPDIILPFFGDILKRGDEATQSLFIRSRAEFEKYLYDNREHLLIVDTWGSQRLIEIDATSRPQDVLQSIYKNLKEAGFGQGSSQDFCVSASSPKRSALTYL